MLSFGFYLSVREVAQLTRIVNTMNAYVFEIPSNYPLKENVEIFFYQTTDCENVAIVKRRRFHDSDSWEVCGSLMLPQKAFDTLQYLNNGPAEIINTRDDFP